MQAISEDLTAAITDVVVADINTHGPIWRALVSQGMPMHESTTYVKATNASIGTAQAIRAAAESAGQQALGIR